MIRTVTFIANDGDDNSNVQTHAISIDSINDDPANTGSLPTDIRVVEETASNVDLSLLNLADVDSVTGNLTVTLRTSAGGIFTASSGGGIVVAGSGTNTLNLTGNSTDSNVYLDSVTNVQYTGLMDVIGNDVDTIQVDVTDNGNTGAGGGGTIALGMVYVDIANINDAPVASPDSLVVSQGATINIAAAGLLANDTDVEGDTLTASLITGPSNGAVTLYPDGSLSYTHDGVTTSQFCLSGRRRKRGF